MENQSVIAGAVLISAVYESRLKPKNSIKEKLTRFIKEDGTDRDIRKGQKVTRTVAAEFPLGGSNPLDLKDKRALKLLIQNYLLAVGKEITSTVSLFGKATIVAGVTATFIQQWNSWVTTCTGRFVAGYGEIDNKLWIGSVDQLMIILRKLRKIEGCRELQLLKEKNVVEFVDICNTHHSNIMAELSESRRLSEVGTFSSRQRRSV